MSNLVAMFENPNKPFSNKTLIIDLNFWTIIQEKDAISLGTVIGLFDFELVAGAVYRILRLREGGYTLA
ncbi:hypothetical protein, partial [Pseudoalteromonas sp. S1649]|uniref:hypothetical protein n=1 Tax=Pseudoalteromonas sp. S1649 TaxID=579508 RepID=UPI00110B961B